MFVKAENLSLLDLFMPNNSLQASSETRNVAFSPHTPTERPTSKVASNRNGSLAFGPFPFFDPVRSLAYDLDADSTFTAKLK